MTAFCRRFGMGRQIVMAINGKSGTELPPVDALFVAMPFCDEYMPCLTLSLFKSILHEAGISSRVQHEYLYFANRIGLEKYRSIMQVCTIGYGHDYFACETIFGDEAHQKTLRFFDEYIRWMTETHLPGKVFAGEQRRDTLESLALFREAHDMAKAYLDEAVARVKASGAKIVAFLSMFQQHNAMIALARRLKREKNAPLILAGGANCEGDAGAALAEHIKAFDYVFTGEADEILAPICKRLLRDGKIPDGELPPGVVSRTKKTAAPAKITTNLDALPLPDFGDYFRERDALLPGHAGDYVVTVEGSRGCWWAAKHPCRFCGLNGSAAHVYREKTVARFADELARMADAYPGAECYFADNILSLSHQKELPDELMKRASYRKNRFRLFTEIKSSASEADIARLAEVGFFWVQAGIESFSDGILKLMGKGVSAIRQVQMMKHCRAHNMRLLWYILVGTPGETEAQTEEMNDVLPKIMHLESPNTVAHVMFLRYNAYMEAAGAPGHQWPSQGGDGVPALAPDKGYDFVFPNEDFIHRTAHLFAPTDEKELARYYDYRQIGPAYEKLYVLTESWRNEPQMLFMKDKGTEIKILDTRLIAQQPIYHLTGAAAALIRAARDAIRKDVLIEMLAGHFEVTALRDALDDLVRENLLLFIKDEYLSLPVERMKTK